MKMNTILRSQELIDKSFSRARKIEEGYYRDKTDKVRAEIQDKVSTIESISCSHLDRIVKKFPSIEKIHPFYQDLIDLMFDIDHYKISLSRVMKTSEKIKEISTQTIRKSKGMQDIRQINELMRSYYGRFSSLVNGLNDDLLFLGKCRDYMKRIPEINLDMKTYIIAGMPNVGKSSLLTALTTATPKIAPYPFTTKSIMIGYAESNGNKVQIIDTPGILDRDFSGMNDIEKNAILALKDINGTIIFLFDYSESSLYPAEVQNHLYRHIKENINPRVVRVQTKRDISEKIVEDIAITVNSEDGLDPIRKLIFS